LEEEEVMRQRGREEKRMIYAYVADGSANAK